jgi:hypothetical protein
MKQVIFLGFYCQIYKKAPTARIYVGDVMIDEIKIPEFYTDQYIKDGKLHVYENITPRPFYENIPSRPFSDMALHPSVYEDIHYLDRYSWYKGTHPSNASFEDICLKDTNSDTKKNIKHPMLFVYIIDDENLKSTNNKITIIVQNSDSNYTNGFMTKSTLLYLSTFYIIPYALFKDPIEITQRWLNVWSRKATSNSLKKILQSYKGTRYEYPVNLKNYFKLIRNNIEENNFFVCGEDCRFEIELKKKYHIWWPSSIKTLGFIYISWIFVKDFIVGLLDKYKQNENQRNTD